MSDIKKDLESFNLIVASLLKNEKEHPVTEKIEPDLLFEKLDLSLREEPISEEEFLKILQDIVLSTPKTATNLFFNQLFGGRQTKAVLGDLLAVMLNSSMYTYKVAGPQVGIEQEVIKRTCEMAGYGKVSGGTFTAGGSMGNFMGMIMGRDAYDLNIRNKGVPKQMMVYTSEESHYSIAKNSSFLGIGRNHVRYIPTNSQGEMIPGKLEEQINEDIDKGNAPFFVNATAGTTVLGAFDPVDEIAVISKKYNLWLHIDGAYCGSVLFSHNYKHLLKGIEKSDSFSFNAHKMMGTPLICSIILVHNKEHLYASFDNDAAYLYQTDRDEYNLGKTSFQCGRRNDALKFWTLWKALGTKGLSQMVDKQFYLADIARHYIRNHPDYTLISFDHSISVCFNYKNIPASELCTALYEDHKTLVGFGSIKGTECVRLVTINANNSKEDILNFFKVIEDYVADLTKKPSF